jgi:AP-1 complex subunit sigma 1/2
MINYILLVSRQGLCSPDTSRNLQFDFSLPALGKVRLAKWFTTMSPKAKAKIVKDVTQLVLARRTRMCNFLEYKGAAKCIPSYSAVVLKAALE